MKLIVVIPATAGREANLLAVVNALQAQRELVDHVIVVDDGGELFFADRLPWLNVLRLPKHVPGLEQPRNVGVRMAAALGATHVWFVDSDVVVVPDAHEHILAALIAEPDRVLVCPYEWLGGERPESTPNFWTVVTGPLHRNDPRWPLFDASAAGDVYLHDVGAGLACFSGNLVWPVESFTRLGGFWSELHHGRCEDGELGLRAVATGVPISFIAAARGFHLHHYVNLRLVLDRNARDVPMLNARHPWVQDADVVLSDRDGAAFDVRCPCGMVVPSNGWWEHAAACRAATIDLPVTAHG